MTQTFRLNIVLGLLLLASSGLALLTNTPPSFVTAVWPPTGIGLAAVMVFGRRTLPAIVASEFLVLLFYSYTFGQSIGFPFRFAAAALIGLSYAAQARFGAWLLRRSIGLGCPLTGGGDIFKFLAIAGPIHTFPQCVLSVTLACVFQFRPWGDFWSAAGEWWWSEAVGGLVFTPMTLAFLAGPATIWRPRRLALALPLLIGTLAVVVLLSVANRWDDRAVRWKLTTDTEAVADDVSGEFNRFLLTLKRARTFIPNEWSALEPGSKGRLEPVIDNFRATYPFVTRVTMIYEVDGRDLEAYRATAASYAGKVPPREVWERAADGTPVPAETRERYCPVAVTYPEENAPWPEGLDLASLADYGPILKDLRSTREPTLVPSESPTGASDWVVFLPLRAATRAFDGSAAVSGYLAVGIDPDRLVARADGLDRTRGVRFTLVPAAQFRTPSAVSETQNLTLAGAEFRLVGAADPIYISTYRTSLSWVVAIVGVGLSILLTALLLIVTGRAAVVAEAVTVRTAALHAEIESRIGIEENLRASEARLAEAQRIAQLGAWEWDADPDVIAWTDELTTILGPPPGPDPALRDLLSFIRSEDRSDAERLVRDASERNREGEVEVRVRTAAGRDRVVAFKVVPVNSKFPGRAVRGTLQDVTDRRRFEDKLRDTQRLESLGVLAGGIAHDFNNLLTGVLGNAALLREQLPPASPYHDSLRVIEHSAEHAAALCQQMLAYAGRGPSVQGPVELNRSIEESADLIRLSVHKKIDLQFDLAAGLPVLRADAGQLRQVLLNFVTNASEAIGGHAGRVTIRTGASRPPCRNADAFHGCDRLPSGSYAWFEVEDSGCGMTPEVKARVFEPFFTTKFTGRGLGLSAVHGIVRGHVGEVCLTSTPGYGTTIRVYLPGAGDPSELLTRTPPPHSSLTAVVGTPKPRVPASPAVPAPIAGSEVVIVADDEPAVRAFAAQALRTAGYEVREAVDGYEAVSQVADDPSVKALVLDVTMPGMDGRDTLDRLARIRPDVPVVLISGYSEHELQDLFSTGTVKGFVSKPFRAGDLIVLVQRAIARSNRQPAVR